MQDNEGFKILRDAFAKFAGQYSNEDLGGRITRSLAAGAKGAVDKSMVEFPKDFVSQMAKDVYALITSQEMADGISASVRFYDEEQVKALMDNVVASMKDPVQSIEIAKKLKEMLSKVPAQDLGAQLGGMMDMAGLPMESRMMFEMFFMQIQPLLDSMKDGTDEEVAAQLAEIADQIPTDLIAAQVAQLTKEVTPERVSQQAHGLVSGMPSPTAIAEIVHGVAGSASEQFGEIANGADPASAMMAFAENAKEVVQQALSGDGQKKKPKKGRFDFGN